MTIRKTGLPDNPRGILILALPASLLVLALAGGCGPIAGFTTMLFAPDEEVEAQYQPDPEKLTLVYVDDSGLESRQYVMTQKLAEHLTAELKQNKVVQRTVPYENLIRLQQRKPNAMSMYTPDQIAQQLGAEQLVLVKIKQLTVTDPDAPGMFRGHLSYTVSVRDPQNHSELWPRDQIDGHPLPDVTLKEESSEFRHYGQRVRQKLIERAVPPVAKLFYDHKVPRM
ncbi:MAG: hypothetical protein ACLFUJ_15070 [Phycisphaerae bacterium]